MGNDSDKELTIKTSYGIQGEEGETSRGSRGRELLCLLALPAFQNMLLSGGIVLQQAGIGICLATHIYPQAGADHPQ